MLNKFLTRFTQFPSFNKGMCTIHPVYFFVHFLIEMMAAMLKTYYSLLDKNYYNQIKSDLFINIFVCIFTLAKALIVSVLTIIFCSKINRDGFKYFYFQ